MNILVSTMCILVLGVCLGVASPCHAFVPESAEVAASVSKTMKALSSFQAILSFPAYPEITCKLWVKGKLWRQEYIETVQGQPMLVRAVLGKGTSLVRVLPQQDNTPVPGLIIWRVPLAKWMAAGVDGSVMSYQFLLDQPCLVVGARDGETRTNQFWMENDRHVPVRVIYQTEAGTSDLIWDEWANIGHFWLPHRMWRSGMGQEPLEIHIRWNGVNIPLQDELFAVSSMNRHLQGKQMFASSSRFFSLMDGPLPGAAQRLR